jgi:regulator of nonsense transcripts 2
MHDKRSFNSLMNCVMICKPAESSIKKKVKVRPIEEEYLRFLIFQMLNKDSARKISIIIRRFDWATHENLIFKVIYKFLSKANENQIKSASILLSLLKPYRQSLIINILNIFLEELRICLDRNDFYDNQHKILICMLISHFYHQKLFNSDIIFYVLYMILTYNPEWNLGRRELISENSLDDVNDTIRIQMVVTILDICGNLLNMGTKKERLIEFMHFLQLYVLSKLFLPLDVENRIINCMENLFGDKNLNIYNDFTEALKDSKKFKGFNYEFENEGNGKEIENNKVKDEKEKENDNDVHEFDRNKFNSKFF